MMNEEKERWIKGSELVAGVHSEQNSNSQGPQQVKKLKEEISIGILRDAKITIIFQRYDIYTEYDGAEVITPEYKIYVEKDGNRLVNLVTSEHKLYRKVKDEILEKYVR